MEAVPKVIAIISQRAKVLLYSGVDSHGSAGQVELNAATSVDTQGHGRWWK